MAYSLANFARSVLQADLSASTEAGQTLSLAAAAPPLQNPAEASADAPGVLVLLDRPATPSKIEVVTYTARSVQGDRVKLSGVARAQEGTAPQAWPAGTPVYQGMTAAVIGDLQATVTATIGKLQKALDDKANIAGSTFTGAVTVDGQLTCNGKNKGKYQLVLNAAANNWARILFPGQASAVWPKSIGWVRDNKNGDAFKVNNDNTWLFRVDDYGSAWILHNAIVYGDGIFDKMVRVDGPLKCNSKNNGSYQLVLNAGANNWAQIFFPGQASAAFPNWVAWTRDNRNGEAFKVHNATAALFRVNDYGDTFTSRNSHVDGSGTFGGAVTIDGPLVCNGENKNNYQIIMNVATNSFMQIAFPGRAGAAYPNPMAWVRDNKNGEAFKVNNATAALFRVNDYGDTWTLRNAYVLGSLSAASVVDTCDARLKRNIRRDPHRWRGLRKKIEMVLYDRIDGSSDNEPGVIAQEVQRVAPEFVSERNGRLCVHYGKLALACALDPEGVA